MKKILEFAIMISKGFVLGIAMVLPGLSGGTMAFIMGIYEKLIGEVSKARTKHLRILFSCLSFKKNRIRKSLIFFGETWDWSFLVPLIFGVVFSGVLFVVLASPLIDQYSLQFYSIIFGLVLASVFKPFKTMEKTAKTFFLFFISFAINIFLFAFGENFSLFDGDFVFLVFLPVGFLVSAALMIPGLSGSYLLLVFGLYERTLLALRQGDLLIISCFLIGSMLGIFLTARFIQYLLKNYFNETMALILGLILGSLYTIYPLPKHSVEDILSFDIQKQIFLFYFVSSFLIFMIFDLFYEMKKSLIKL